MELKMVFYLISVTNAVNISQQVACIGVGLHALIQISQPSACIGVGLHALIHISQPGVWTRPIYLPKVRQWYSDLL